MYAATVLAAGALAERAAPEEAGEAPAGAAGATGTGAAVEQLVSVGIEDARSRGEAAGVGGAAAAAAQGDGGGPSPRALMVAALWSACAQAMAPCGGEAGYVRLEARDGAVENPADWQGQLQLALADEVVMATLLRVIRYWPPEATPAALARLAGLVGGRYLRPGPPRAAEAGAMPWRAAGASVGPGARAGDAGWEACEWWMEEAAELWLRHVETSSDAQFRTGWDVRGIAALRAWVERYFAMPDCSSLGEVLQDDEVMRGAMCRAHQRVLARATVADRIGAVE
jgi:hypothetical protein